MNIQIDPEMYANLGQVFNWAEEYYNGFEEKDVLGSITEERLRHLQSIKDSFYKAYNSDELVIRRSDKEQLKHILEEAQENNVIDEAFIQDIKKLLLEF